MMKTCASNKVGLKVKLDMLYLIFKMAASLFPLLAIVCLFFPQRSPYLMALVYLSLLPSVVFMFSYYFNIGRNKHITKQNQHISGACTE